MDWFCWENLPWFLPSNISVSSINCPINSYYLCTLGIYLKCNELRGTPAWRFQLPNAAGQQHPDGTGGIRLCCSIWADRNVKSRPQEQRSGWVVKASRLASCSHFKWDEARSDKIWFLWTELN